MTEQYRPEAPWQGGHDQQQYAPSTQQQHVPNGYQPMPGYQPAHYAATPPRKKRRVFWWVFLAIQALFLAWIIVGVATVHTGPTHADLASACYHGNWRPLFSSQHDCVVHYGHLLSDAGNVGKGLGAALIVVFWVVVDFFLGLGYLIYKLSTRSR